MALVVASPKHAFATADNSVRTAFGNIDYAETAKTTVAGLGCTGCHNGTTPPTVFTRPLFQTDLAAPYDDSILNKVNSAFAPAFAAGGTSLTVNKSAADATTIGPVTLSQQGAYGVATIPVPAAYNPNVEITAGGTGFRVAGSGTAWNLQVNGNKPFAGMFAPITVEIRARNPEGLYCKQKVGAVFTACDTKRFTVTLTNNKPTLSATNFPNAVANTDVTINLTAVDPDGDPVTIAGLTNITGLGTFSNVVPAVNALQFSYKAPLGITGLFTEQMSVTLDDTSGPVTVPFTIKASAGANVAPTAPNATFTMAEDVPFNGTLPATDTDPLSFTPLGTTTLPHGNILINADGTFTYTPALNDTAGDTINYTATDTFAVSASGTLTFVVTPAPDLPAVAAGAAVTVNQVTNVAGSLTQDLNAFVTDPDTLPAQRQFAFTSIDNDRAGTISVSPAGVLQYNARVNWAGIFNVAFTVTDAPGDPTRTVNGLLTVTVLLNGKGGHDQPGGAQIAAVAGSLANRYTPYFPASNKPEACLNCHQPGRVLEKAPDCNTTFFTFYGAELCKVRPFDSDFSSRLQDISAQFEPSFTVGQAQPIEVPENAAIGAKVGQKLAFLPGKDLDGNTSTIATARIDSSSPADAATYFALDASGQLTVSKSLSGLSQSLVTIFPQPVNDAKQRNTTGTPDAARQGGFYQPKGIGGTVTIFVRKLVPVVSNDSYQTNTDTSLPLDMDVTANDTGGGPIDALVDVTQPAKGTVTIVGKKLQYVSDGISTGTFTFTYKASRNGVGVSETAATVSVTVYGANAAVAQPDGPYDVIIGETITLPVQANDRGPKPFTGFQLVAASLPQHGSAQIAGQDITYQAISEGLDVFKYEVIGGGVTTEATVTVRVGKVSGAVLEAATNNPLLKPVARALGDTCRDINRSGSAQTDAQTDLVGICNALVDQASTPGAIDQALDQIRNEEALVVGDAVQQHDRASANNIMGRLDSIRNGKGRGLNFSQFGLQIDETTISGALVDATIQKASAEQSASGKEDLPWGVFLAGTVTVATQDGNGREAGFDLGGVMLTAGLDYKIDEKALIGIAISGGQAIIDIGGGSELTSRSFQLAGYGSFTMTENLYLDGYAGFAVNGYDMSRAIAFTSGATAVDRRADSAFNGEALSAALRLKYATQLGETDLETYATLNYLKVWTNSYVETGAGGLGLAVGKQDFDTLAATVGMRLSKPFDLDSGVIKPYFGVAYSRQLITDDRSVASRFAAGLPGSPEFLVSSETDGENFGTIELGLSAEFIDQTSASIDLSGTFSDGGFQGYQAKIGVDIPLGYQPPAPSKPPTAPTKKKAKLARKPVSPTPSVPAETSSSNTTPSDTGGGGAGGGSSDPGAWGG